MLEILYEDSEICVVVKPAGMESQASRGFEPDMLSEIKNHLSTARSTKTSTRMEEPYVGVIHRLDKPVGGVMAYAKSPKAAASLSKQIQARQMEKVYQAVVCGKLVDNVGNFVDYLLKDGKNNCSRIVDKTHPQAKRAELSYRVLSSVAMGDADVGIVAAGNAAAGNGLLSLVEIKLLTGRHHQIRVQFAGRGTPLWGDAKYNPHWKLGKVENSPGSPTRGKRDGLALYACRLAFFHPKTGELMEFCSEPRGEAFERFRLSEPLAAAPDCAAAEGI